MAEAVKITLSLDNPESQAMPFPRRELVLDPENKSIVIGRASKAETKGLVSLPNNAWFLSPVMSRQHAEIVANLEEKRVTVKDLGSLHGTYVNGSKDKLEKDELRELRDGDRLQLGLSIFRGADAFPPTTLGVNIEYREKKTDCPTTTFQVPDCSDVEEDYSSDSNSDVQELAELEPRTPTLPIPKIGSTVFNVIDLTQLPARDMHHYQIIDLSSPPHSPLSIGDNDDLNSIVELSDVGSPLPDRSASPDNSSGVASPDLSTTSPNISMTSPEITACNEESSPLAGPTEVCNDNDSSSGYESSYHGSLYDDTDGDEEMDDDGFPFGENESSDGEASDQDSLDHEAAISSPGLLNLDDESILRSDSEEDEDSEDLDEDPDFDDYSSQDEASDYARFPDEDLERVLASISQRSNNNIAPKDSQAITNESGESPHAAQRPPLDTYVLPAYPTVPDFCVAPSDSVSNGFRSTGAVAINTLLNAEKTPQHKGVATTEAEVVIQPTAMFTAREPSPSDAVMPKSCFPSQAEKPRNGTQLLAERLGKVEYFAARQQNKILAAKIQRAPEPRSSVYTLCNGVSNGRGPFGLDTASTMGQFLKKYTEDPEPEPLLQLPDVNWTEPVPEPTESQETVSTGEPGDDAVKLSQSLSEIAPTNSDTDDQSLRRTHVGILDIVETCQPAPAQAAQPKQEVKDVRAKRKADDISDSNAGEEEWAQRADLEKANLEKERIVAPQSHQMSPTAQGSTTGSPAPRTVVSQDADVRPTKKLRLFAEKLGYAALGGVTAGAMIFGTLVYTAPTFV